jgi:hypothetical protein
LGGGLDADQIAAMDDGTLRAKQHLTQAATLDVNGDLVRITNMTGHKVISGYPEGRRMWLNIKFYDNTGGFLEEVGEWGPLQTTATNPVDGSTFTPKSIVDLDNPKLKVYEVHPAMTKEWADVLLSEGVDYPATMPLSFNRLTGAVDFTLGNLAALPAGAYHETFHFALNNHIGKDNRIPPYRMSYDEARKRNSLPVPDSQYGGSPGGEYEHWDEFDIGTIAPAGADSAHLTLYYQGTSWEYVQFLNNAVDTTDDGLGAPNPVTPFLADEGKNFLDAWLNAQDANGNTMVPPHVMATATWGAAICVPEPEICDDTIDNDCDNLVDCADPDCDADPACPNLIEWPDCFDGIDNDGNGDTDCADITCLDETTPSTCGVGECGSTGTKTCLSNGTMEDTCTPGTPTFEICTGGLDEDCDGMTDCADSDCDSDPACQMDCGQYTSRKDCNKVTGCTWDRDLGMCVADVVCVPTDTVERPNETCQDGFDNDCDGMIDCADTADCDPDPDCQVMMDCTMYGDQATCEMYPDVCRWNKKQGCKNR